MRIFLYISIIIRGLGSIWLAGICTTIIRSLFRPFWRAELVKYKTSSEPWALVTGSSGGIGFGVARELCRQGFNIILHGRSMDRLETAQTSLEEEFPGQKTKVIAYDICEGNVTGATKVFGNKLEDLNLRLLVNMAGIGHDPSSFKAFSNQTAEDVDYIINANITFTTQLIHILLPQLSKDRSKASLIINTSSIAPIGSPWTTIASASKSFIETFSLALAAELENENSPVDIITMNIEDTHSPGHSMGTNFYMPSLDIIGKTIVEEAGRSVKDVVRIPSLRHEILHGYRSVKYFGFWKSGLMTIFFKTNWEKLAGVC